MTWAQSRCRIPRGAPFAIAVGEHAIAVVTGGSALFSDARALPGEDCSLTDLGLRQMESVVGAHFVAGRGLVVATSGGRVLLVEDQSVAVLADMAVSVNASGVVGETLFMLGLGDDATWAYGFDLVDRVECPEPVELVGVLRPRETMGFQGGFFLVDNRGAVFSMRRIQDCNGMGFYD